MSPISSLASRGYLRSSIMAKGRGQSIDPNAFLTSMYVKYMFFFVIMVFLSAARMARILSGGVSQWSEAFLAVVEDFVLFYECGE